MAVWPEQGWKFAKLATMVASKVSHGAACELGGGEDGFFFFDLSRVAKKKGRWFFF